MPADPPSLAVLTIEAAMQRALALAEQSIALSEPNPRVGCVIVDAQGRLLGEGHTREAGGPHAEIVALRDAATRGARVEGSTVVVTLEPCSHHGRTPPCADALVAARVGRVVMAIEDPNPLVAGSGAARLRAAGIAVETAGEALASAARELNVGFFSRMQRERPWVRLKAAISLDGRTALPDGRSQWITGLEARTDGHAWRRRAGAVLTGVGTVLDDDPRLDVRLVPAPRQPLRVLVDSRLDAPLHARLLQPPGQVLVYAARPTPDRRQALEAAGIEVADLASSTGKVDLAAMLTDLARRGVNELHVEAGHKLNGSFVREGLVDEWLVYVAPKLLGVGRDLALFGPIAGLDAAPRLRFESVTRIGEDLRVLARPLAAEHATRG
ncbi:MAG TPA: bifunctional diaminohydroxyphosphoribosylaminopyrimidine deaminase/5-amino-6-(5-phosphoribosylamino)uracil reductase RibD [Caldimonas sp.]|nr:bifunctional diaminohydroxyphosphoribosylaminopyrimidine deaminase/5-amino-6-(5-phosphoribosylamino)uracil reductase RibD [Caldimonas sp.]